MRRQSGFVMMSVMVGLLFLLLFSSSHIAFGVQILSKSKLEKCLRNSDSNDNLNCTNKIVLNLAVPSGSSGGEASIVAEIVEAEENATLKMQTMRVPPVVTVNKSAAYALYELTYIRDVSYKPEEYYVKTRKCEPDASEKVVKVCERLQDENGHIMEYTEPICCPCGPNRRTPSSCGNVFDKWMKGKANTAHCVRFPGDWFHIFSIGQRSLGFSVKIEVKTGSKTSEVILGPDNRTATSNDNFLRVNLIGDFVGYTNIPSFEDFYLAIPRQGGPGQPQSMGGNFSMWMLLERLRFTLDGLECNKIGVGYEAFNEQPSFCSSPFWSCLHNQLWNFWEADQNRIKRKQVPLYGVEGRFERINQHPNAGTHSFSIGVTEVLNTNLVIELSADDIDYVYQRSPGKILNINISTFEALSQFGVATISTKNTGEIEASYSLTFDCTREVTLMEEQYFIMKPKEETTRSFKLYPGTDQAAKYFCSAILKDSDYNEVDRAECQFSTTSTILDNGTQSTPLHPKKHGVTGFFESIANIWNEFWNGLADFITGNTCRKKCNGFFDFKCHIQYICMSWLVMFGIFLAIFPTVIVLLWLLHQKGLFDPIYDWWEDHCWSHEDDRMNNSKRPINRHDHHYNNRQNHANKQLKLGTKHQHHHQHHQNNVAPHKRRRAEKETDRNRHLHHVSHNKDNRHKHKQTRVQGANVAQHFDDEDAIKTVQQHGKRRKEKEFEIEYL